MLRMYSRNGNKLIPVETCLPADPPIWMDLIDPSPQEVQQVEQGIAITLPTKAEMEEIELSARLYSEEDAVFMTMTALAHLDTDSPIKTPITFVLKGKSLVTVRYVEPKPFLAYLARAQRAGGLPHQSGEQVMLGLIEAMIDRTADALERVGNEMDTISKEIFKKGREKANKKTRNLEALIAQVGHKAELLTMVQESLVSSSRLIAYYAAVQEAGDDNRTTKQLMRIIQRDATALGDHARALSSRLDFLLNATLGLINLEQNQIIKIFSVAAVVFLPPTLVASIYGMNFDFMPELDWVIGYPWAIGLMALSALLPFLYFKRKGWL
ncbi:MAG TPA: magnesium/cobalt transporter CorA [Devosia sp.]|jgi:magnesium transporter|uniref:magnesium/cobalt transporter CorA n=1 Tax=Devosia sp. TaxID=1871048 RepID=UPI002F948367